jgi:hypothetical protein
VVRDRERVCQAYDFLCCHSSENEHGDLRGALRPCLKAGSGGAEMVSELRRFTANLDMNS